MTSTNDGKDVKSNLTSGQTEKKYYIARFQSLEARLNGQSSTEERTQNVCEAWRLVHGLCSHSTPETRSHLLSWIQRNTAYAILQDEWGIPENKPHHVKLEKAINDFIVKCHGTNTLLIWESTLLRRAVWFKGVLSNPWGHAVLKALLDPKGIQPTDQEVVGWLREERAMMFVTRLRVMARAKRLLDLALVLVSAIMTRARRAAPAQGDADQAGTAPGAQAGGKVANFVETLSREAGFTKDVWELLIDIEFVLLHKQDQATCIDLAKKIPLKDGKRTVERLCNRVDKSPADKKLWKKSKDVAILIAQVVITRCMVVSTCAGVVCDALTGCAGALAQLLEGSRLQQAAAAMAAPAASAAHLYAFADAIARQCKDKIEQKPFICELYVRAITAGMNELEKLKLEKDKEAEVCAQQHTLSVWFTQLGEVLSSSGRLRCECLLTAFSLHPSADMYDLVAALPLLDTPDKSPTQETSEVTSEFGSWATDSRTSSNFVKTSETLNLKQTHKHANILSSSMFDTECGALGLKTELCEDLAVLLSGPRVKTLSFDMDREAMLENCRVYKERTQEGTRALTTELKYLNLDPKTYDHLPEEEDDEENYYGIEKGYEPSLEYEDIWSDTIYTERCDSVCSISTVDSTKVTSKSKSKKYHVQCFDEEIDPLLIDKEAINPYQSTSENTNEPIKKQNEGHRKKSKSKMLDTDSKKLSESDQEKELLKKQKRKERRERKKREKMEMLLKQELQIGMNDNMTNLIGTKVLSTQIEPVKGKQKHKSKRSQISDSDYDSQGKSSLASNNSEGNGTTDAIFDGLFSMDEVRSPEKTICNNLSNKTLSNMHGEQEKLQFVKDKLSRFLQFRSNRKPIDQCENNTQVPKYIDNLLTPNNTIYSSYDNKPQQTVVQSSLPNLCKTSSSEILNNNLKRPENFCGINTFDRHLLTNASKRNDDTASQKYLQAHSAPQPATSISGLLMSDQHQKQFKEFLKLQNAYNLKRQGQSAPAKVEQSEIAQKCPVLTDLIQLNPTLCNSINDNNIKPGKSFLKPDVSKIQQQNMPIAETKKHLKLQKCGVDNVPNTFSRLSYMHKNKQADMKHKQLNELEPVKTPILNNIDNESIVKINNLHAKGEIFLSKAPKKSSATPLIKQGECIIRLPSTSACMQATDLRLNIVNVSKSTKDTGQNKVIFKTEPKTIVPIDVQCLIHQSNAGASNNWTSQLPNTTVEKKIDVPPINVCNLYKDDKVVMFGVRNKETTNKAKIEQQISHSVIVSHLAQDNSQSEATLQKESTAVESDDWQYVMNKLRSLKSSKRGVDALEMTMKRIARSKGNSEISRLVSNKHASSSRGVDSRDHIKMPSKRKEWTSPVQPKQSVTKNEISQKSNQPVIIKKITKKAVSKSADPTKSFIMAKTLKASNLIMPPIHNSDYDQLDDLIDDELRQEIEESSPLNSEDMIYGSTVMSEKTIQPKAKEISTVQSSNVNYILGQTSRQSLISNTQPNPVARVSSVIKENTQGVPVKPKLHIISNEILPPYLKSVGSETDKYATKSVVGEFRSSVIAERPISGSEKRPRVTATGVSNMSIITSPKTVVHPGNVILRNLSLLNQAQNLIITPRKTESDSMHSSPKVEQKLLSKITSASNQTEYFVLKPQNVSLFSASQITSQVVNQIVTEKAHKENVTASKSNVCTDWQKPNHQLCLDDALKPKDHQKVGSTHEGVGVISQCIPKKQELNHKLIASSKVEANILKEEDKIPSIKQHIEQSSDKTLKSNLINRQTLQTCPNQIKDRNKEEISESALQKHLQHAEEIPNTDIKSKTIIMHADRKSLSVIPKESEYQQNATKLPNMDLFNENSECEEIIIKLHQSENIKEKEKSPSILSDSYDQIIDAAFIEGLDSVTTRREIDKEQKIDCKQSNMGKDLNNCDKEPIEIDVLRCENARATKFTDIISIAEQDKNINETVTTEINNKMVSNISIETEKKLETKMLKTNSNNSDMFQNHNKSNMSLLVYTSPQNKAFESSPTGRMLNKFCERKVLSQVQEHQINKSNEIIENKKSERNKHSPDLKTSFEKESERLKNKRLSIIHRQINHVIRSEPIALMYTPIQPVKSVNDDIITRSFSAIQNNAKDKAEQKKKLDDKINDINTRQSSINSKKDESKESSNIPTRRLRSSNLFRSSNCPILDESPLSQSNSDQPTHLNNISKADKTAPKCISQNALSTDGPIVKIQKNKLRDVANKINEVNANSKPDIMNQGENNMNNPIYESIGNSSKIVEEIDLTAMEPNVPNCGLLNDDSLTSRINEKPEIESSPIDSKVTEPNVPNCGLLNDESLTSRINAKPEIEPSLIDLTGMEPKVPNCGLLNDDSLTSRINEKPEIESSPIDSKVKEPNVPNCGLLNDESLTSRINKKPEIESSLIDLTVTEPNVPNCGLLNDDSLTSRINKKPEIESSPIDLTVTEPNVPNCDLLNDDSLTSRINANPEIEYSPIDLTVTEPNVSNCNLLNGDSLTSRINANPDIESSPKKYKKNNYDSKHKKSEDNNTDITNLNQEVVVTDIKELPSPNGNTAIKVLRIKLSNGNIFRATVSGNLKVDIKTVLSEPSIKLLLTTDVYHTKSCTLNVRHVGNANNPKKAISIATSIIRKPVHSEVIELSDSEDDNIYYFRTEFGSYKTKSMDSRVYEKHQNRLKQKCVVKIDKFKIGNSTILNKNTILKEDRGGVKEISNVPNKCGNSNSVLVEVSEKILFTEDSKKSVETCSSKTLTLSETLYNLQSTVLESQLAQLHNDCHVNLVRCDQKLKSSQCRINSESVLEEPMVSMYSSLSGENKELPIITSNSESILTDIKNCDELPSLISDFESQVKHTSRLSSLDQNDCNSDWILYTKAKIHRIEVNQQICRKLLYEVVPDIQVIPDINVNNNCLSNLSILSDIEIIDEDKIRSESPSLILNFDLQAKYSNRITYFDQSICNSDWLLCTKATIHSLEVKQYKYIKSVHDLQITTDFTSDNSTDCDSDLEICDLRQKNRKIDAKFQVPSLFNLVYSFITSNEGILERYTTQKNKTSKTYNKKTHNLKRKYNISEKRSDCKIFKTNRNTDSCNVNTTIDSHVQYPRSLYVEMKSTNTADNQNLKVLKMTENLSNIEISLDLAKSCRITNVNDCSLNKRNDSEINYLEETKNDSDNNQDNNNYPRMTVKDNIVYESDEVTKGSIVPKNIIEPHAVNLGRKECNINKTAATFNISSEFVIPVSIGKAKDEHSLEVEVANENNLAIINNTFKELKTFTVKDNSFNNHLDLSNEEGFQVPNIKETKEIEHQTVVETLTQRTKDSIPNVVNNRTDENVNNVSVSKNLNKADNRKTDITYIKSDVIHSLGKNNFNSSFFLLRQHAETEKVIEDDISNVIKILPIQGTSDLTPLIESGSVITDQIKCRKNLCNSELIVSNAEIFVESEKLPQDIDPGENSNSSDSLSQVVTCDKLSNKRDDEIHPDTQLKSNKCKNVTRKGGIHILTTSSSNIMTNKNHNVEIHTLIPNAIDSSTAEEKSNVLDETYSKGEIGDDKQDKTCNPYSDSNLRTSTDSLMNTPLFVESEKSRSTCMSENEREIQTPNITGDINEKKVHVTDNKKVKDFENDDKQKKAHESVTLTYKGDSNFVLKGSPYVDPVVGTCYIFPLSDSCSRKDFSTFNSDQTMNIIKTLKRKSLSENDNDLTDQSSFSLVLPKITYSKHNANQRQLKRKSDSNNECHRQKKYRKGKNIDSCKQTTSKAYSNQYKRLLEYCTTIKFSYSRPFHKNFIDPARLLKNWPIQDNNHDNNSIAPLEESEEPIFHDIDKENEVYFDPLQQTLAEEIAMEYNEENQYPGFDHIEDSNFNMGFGERSDRVKQNLTCGVYTSKFSAATLSDVKLLQPSFTTRDKKQNISQTIKKSNDEELAIIKRSISFIQIRDRVQDFFRKTALELHSQLHVPKRHNKTTLYELTKPRFIVPPLQKAIVNVVQVGQLPVSASAQNPVTCDPRVTHVSNASPPQCSAENSPDGDQNASKTEYTELTTADLSLPLVQEYKQSSQVIMSSQSQLSGPIASKVSIDMNSETKHEHEQEIESKNEHVEESSNFLTEHKNICNISYSYNPENDSFKPGNDTFKSVNDTYRSENGSYKSDPLHKTENKLTRPESNALHSGNSRTLDVESQNAIFDSLLKEDNNDYVSAAKATNGTSEKTDQIAHAMNAAGITTSTDTMSNSNRAHALVNILSQKIRQNTTQASVSSYTKGSPINAMALQQALAQILPPPLNQTNSSENQNASITPQVLHIVQGKNTSGNQITIVDNQQNTVINNSNNTPVLHIVQNKSAIAGTTSSNSNNVTQHNNSFGGLSLVDAGIQQGGNQLLHIVNTGGQKNNTSGQLLKRVNLLTNLTNVQGNNEQKMVQFVCKSADGKSIQLNAPHQRSMVLRLQPIEATNVTSAAKSECQEIIQSPSFVSTVPTKENNSTQQQEIKSRSVYEENYAKFIQNSSPKPSMPEKSTSLPKFNQAFGKQGYQDNNQKSNEMPSNSSSHAANTNSSAENVDCSSNDNAINLEHINQINSPPLLLRKSPAQTSQPQQGQSNLVQQIKQTIAPVNIQTMHGGVIYTRQIPVNIGGGQTINLITVPSTDLIDESGQKQPGEVKFVNQNEIEPSIIKLVPQNQNNSTSDSVSEENNSLNASNDTPHTTTTTHTQPVLTQMRIKLPMLSKSPQMVSGARLVRPSFFQIQRNVIGGANQPVYQQLVLTAAPSLGQQTIRPPQAQPTRIKTTTENQTSSESQMSSSTLEQLREFDMVLEQVKERSTVQPNSNSNNTFTKLQSPTETTESNTTVSVVATEPTQQVLYSIGNNNSLNVAYVNRKPAAATTATTTFARSPDSSGVADSPTSSTHVQIPAHSSSNETSSETSPQQNQPKTKSSSKSKSRPKTSSNPTSSMKINTVAPKTSTQKPLEDEQTTQRILYILAEYKEQVENSPDKDKPAPRRRSNPPSNPGSSKRKKSSSGSRRPGRDMSPILGEDTCRTMGSEDSSCGTSQGDCTENCLETHSPQDSPRKVARKLTFENETPNTTPRQQPARNVIVADGQTITVARGTAGKPATAVLMPANYILPVSMVKGGQQIAIVTNRGPKILTVGGEGGGNALLLQRLIGPAGLKPVLARPGVRHVRLPTAALHNLQAFNIATTASAQPPDSTASPAPAPTPPDLVETRATSSPWPDRDSQDVKPERSSSPEGSEPWNLPSSADPHDYSYEETVRAENLDRTVLDAIPDRYSPDLEAQRIFDKMFDVDTKKSYIDSQDDSPRCGYDIDASDCEYKAYQQVVQKRDQRQHKLAHVSAAALRHKYAILEHELRLQKSLSEECEDLGVDSPSAAELFPEAELLFASSPAHESSHHGHTPQPGISQSSIPQPDIDDQIATDQLLNRTLQDDQQDLDVSLGLDEGIVTVSEDGMQATITLDQEEFARSHPNTTFHSEPTEEENVQPYTISGIKGRHITSTIFHAGRAPATVLMTAPQTTVISQAMPDNQQNTNIKYIDNIMNSGLHNNICLSSVLVKDDGLTKYDNILNDSRELHLSNTASAIVHSNTTQVIRRVCYDDDKRDSRFLLDETDALIAGDDAKMIAEDSSRDATLESIADDRSSPERHTELFWESNSASERSDSRRPLDFSSDSDKCCKSPLYDETNSTDSSGVGTHMRLDSVIKDARGLHRSGSADNSSADDTLPPLRTYPPKRMYHVDGEMERSVSGKTRAGERSPDGHEVRRRASVRGVVKRGCHCCNGSPAPPRPKKSRQKKPSIDFNN